MKKKSFGLIALIGALAMLGSCAGNNNSTDASNNGSSNVVASNNSSNTGGHHGGPTGPGGPGGHTSSSSDSDDSSSDDTSSSVETDTIDNITSGSASVTFKSSSSSGPGNSSTTKTISAAYLIDGVAVTITSGTYKSASSSSDQVVFLVINGGSLTITGSEDDPVVISKTGSAAFNGQVGDDYNFYGINSAIVVAGSKSSANIKNATITTASNGSNAVVSTVGATINISDTTIATTGSAGSRGLHATYSGKIVADNLNITTAGASCASLATDRGGGTITASNMTLQTNGRGSPLVYSTGTINVTASTGTAVGSQMVVVEGGSTADLDGCTFSCVGNGNRTGTSESNSSSHTIDSAGIFIYQSQSGDSSEGTDYFNATDCSLTVTTSGVPMFFVTNITAVVTLNNNTFTQASSSDYFLIAEETSQWGSTGSNGGKVTMNLTNQSVDSYTAFVGTSSSSLFITATDSSSTAITKKTGTW